MLKEYQRDWSREPYRYRNVAPPTHEIQRLNKKNHGRVVIGPLYYKIPKHFYTRTVLSGSLSFFPLSMSFNSTFIGDDTAAQLYSTLNVNYTQLNWFERQWMAWYLYIGNPLLATGIASFILHEVRLSLPTLQRTAPSSPYADCLFRPLPTVDHH